MTIKRAEIRWINITDLSVKIDEDRPRVFEGVKALTLCGHPQIEWCNFPQLKRDIENVREVLDFYSYDDEVWVLDMGTMQVAFTASEIKEKANEV